MTLGKAGGRDSLRSSTEVLPWVALLPCGPCAGAVSNRLVLRHLPVDFRTGVSAGGLAALVVLSCEHPHLAAHPRGSHAKPYELMVSHSTWPQRTTPTTDVSRTGPSRPIPFGENRSRHDHRLGDSNSTRHLVVPKRAAAQSFVQLLFVSSRRRSTTQTVPATSVATSAAQRSTLR